MLKLRRINHLRVLKQVDTQYNLMVQLDYTLGLCVAATMGAEKWPLFWFLLVISLIFGYITVRLYVRMQRAFYRGE